MVTVPLDGDYDMDAGAIAAAVTASTRIVFLANPHTSGWDLPFTLAVAWSFNMKASWAGKDSLFRKPFGTVLRALGGVPIDRSKRSNQVQRIRQRRSHGLGGRSAGGCRFG